MYREFGTTTLSLGHVKDGHRTPYWADIEVLFKDRCLLSLAGILNHGSNLALSWNTYIQHYPPTLLTHLWDLSSCWGHERNHLLPEAARPQPSATPHELLMKMVGVALPMCRRSLFCQRRSGRLEGQTQTASTSKLLVRKKKAVVERTYDF